jgi:hypothetical protein
MLDRLRPRSIYDVMAAIACFASLATGAAYAADTIGSSDIIDESIQSQDLKNFQVKRADIDASAVTSNKIADGGVTTADLADGTVGAADVADFGLTNEDVGVLFAEVTAAGGLANASGSVSPFHVGAADSGQTSVDFGRDIHACTAVATVGSSGAGAVVNGEAKVSDVSGNDEAMLVQTSTSAGTAHDLPFRLVIVC